MNRYLRLKEMIDKSQRIVLFTGAGISVPSGIPDFRSADGLYNQQRNDYYQPEEIISHTFFKNHPEDFFAFYGAKMVYPNAKPNAAHCYFAKNKKVSAVVTQNIDGLHQSAGSKNVFELHGSVHRNHCMRCHKFYDLSDIDPSKVNYCECGGIIKPDVVLYEEPLQNEVVEAAIGAISAADMLIIVGTSLVVYPAASYIRYFQGKHIVVINKSETKFDSTADLVFNEDIIQVIQELEKL